MTKIPIPFAGGDEQVLSQLNELQKQHIAASKSYYGFKAQLKNGPFLTPRDLAAAFDVSTKTLERWRKRGGGPPYIKILSKHIRYPIAGLETWVRENLTRGEGDEGNYRKKTKKG